MSLFNTSAFAQNRLVDQRTLIDAQFEIRYYEDGMPQIIDNDSHSVEVRNHYRIEATVEFCRNVDASDFSVSIIELGGVNLISLHSDDPVVDCFGPTRSQSLTYPLEDNINTHLPFKQVSNVPIIFEGVVF